VADIIFAATLAGIDFAAGLWVRRKEDSLSFPQYSFPAPQYRFNTDIS
jgi:hypothetical protein